MREFEQAWTVLKQDHLSDETKRFHAILNQMLAEDPHHLDDLGSYVNDFGPTEMRNNLENYLGQATSLEDYKNRVREMDSFMNDEIAMRRDVQGEPLYDRINDFESGDEDYSDAHIDAHERTKEQIARRDRAIAQFPEGSIYVEPDEYDIKDIEAEKEADKKEREQANALTQFQQLNRGESMNSFEHAWTLLKSLQEADRIMRDEDEARHALHLSRIHQLQELSRLAPYQNPEIMDDDVSDAVTTAAYQGDFYPSRDKHDAFNERAVGEALHGMQGEVGAHHTLTQQLQELGIKDKARAKALGAQRHMSTGERQLRSGADHINNQYPAEEHPMYGLVPEYPDQPSGPMAEANDPMMATGEMPMPRGPLTEEENRKRLLGDMKRDFMRPEAMSHGMNLAMLEMARRAQAPQTPQMRIDPTLAKLMSGQQLTDEEYQYLQTLD